MLIKSQGVFLGRGRSMKPFQGREHGRELLRSLPVNLLYFFIACFLILQIPAMSQAQTTQSGPPPVDPTIVREGDFAVRLLFELGLGTAEDEIAAETHLGKVGIVPRNGWIADYPVTPDVYAELQKAVSEAADSKKLSMSREAALKRLDTVNIQLGLSVKPYAGEKDNQTGVPDSANYLNPTEINDYYYTQGPPIVTYYAPPPDYYYLYAWVPFPFWYADFWFPGFFVLHDFHKTVFIHNRVGFVSNHFNDIRFHRAFRIDPLTRFRGRTFAGIGASRSRNFMSTGVPRSEERIFHGPREHWVPGNRMISPPNRPRGMMRPPSAGSFNAPPSRPAGPPATSHGGMGVPHSHEGSPSHGGQGFQGRGRGR
jgi:hypothetical protein